MADSRIQYLTNTHDGLLLDFIKKEDASTYEAKRFLTKELPKESLPLLVDYFIFSLNNFPGDFDNQTLFFGRLFKNNQLKPEVLPLLLEIIEANHIEQIKTLIPQISSKIYIKGLKFETFLAQLGYSEESLKTFIIKRNLSREQTLEDVQKPETKAAKPVPQLLETNTKTKKQEAKKPSYLNGTSSSKAKNKDNSSLTNSRSQTLYGKSKQPLNSRTRSNTTNVSAKSKPGM